MSDPACIVRRGAERSAPRSRSRAFTCEVAPYPEHRRAPRSAAPCPAAPRRAGRQSTTDRGSAAVSRADRAVERDERPDLLRARCCRAHGGTASPPPGALPSIGYASRRRAGVHDRVPHECALLRRRVAYSYRSGARIPRPVDHLARALSPRGSRSRVRAGRRHPVNPRCRRPRSTAQWTVPAGRCRSARLRVRGLAADRPATRRRRSPRRRSR